MFLLYLFLILALLCSLVIFVLAGRRNHPDLPKLRGWSYAHRGLHSEGVPENSMAAFRAALDHGYGIELDIHLMADGNLAVIHDSTLRRTTGREGRIEDLTTADLPEYTLEGTSETIPTFRELLDLYAGKAPLIIELKPVGNNHAALAEAACRMMEGYPGLYCMESFDPRCIQWLRKNHPEIIRGQLTECYAKTSPLHPVLRFLLSHNAANLVGRPDFVAYNFGHRHKSVTNKIWKALGIQGVAWTLRTPEAYREAVEEGWLPIFEKFIP